MLYCLCSKLFWICQGSNEQMWKKTKATFSSVTNDQNTFVAECSVDSGLENRIIKTKIYYLCLILFTAVVGILHFAMMVGKKNLVSYT